MKFSRIFREDIHAATALVFVTLFADINDLFRPLWFFQSISQVIICNVFGLAGLSLIWLKEQEEKKK